MSDLIQNMSDLIQNMSDLIQNMSDLFFWCFHVKLTTLLLDVLVQTVNVA